MTSSGPLARKSAAYTSRLRASVATRTTGSCAAVCSPSRADSSSRARRATASRLETPWTGTPRVRPTTLAVTSPARSPVKGAGPMAATTASSGQSATSGADSDSESICPRDSACLRVSVCSAWVSTRRASPPVAALLPGRSTASAVPALSTTATCVPREESMERIRTGPAYALGSRGSSTRLSGIVSPRVSPPVVPAVSSPFSPRRDRSMAARGIPRRTATPSVSD